MATGTHTELGQRQQQHDDVVGASRRRKQFGVRSEGSQGSNTGNRRSRSESEEVVVTSHAENTYHSSSSTMSNGEREDDNNGKHRRRRNSRSDRESRSEDGEIGEERRRSHRRTESSLSSNSTGEGNSSNNTRRLMVDRHRGKAKVRGVSLDRASNGGRNSVNSFASRYDDVDQKTKQLNHRYSLPDEDEPDWDYSMSSKLATRLVNIEGKRPRRRKCHEVPPPVSFVLPPASPTPEHCRNPLRACSDNPVTAGDCTSRPLRFINESHTKNGYNPNKRASKLRSTLQGGEGLHRQALLQRPELTRETPQTMSERAFHAPNPLRTDERAQQPLPVQLSHQEHEARARRRQERRHRKRQQLLSQSRHYYMDPPQYQDQPLGDDKEMPVPLELQEPARLISPITVNSKGTARSVDDSLHRWRPHMLPKDQEAPPPVHPPLRPTSFRKPRKSRRRGLDFIDDVGELATNPCSFDLYSFLGDDLLCGGSSPADRSGSDPHIRRTESMNSRNYRGWRTDDDLLSLTEARKTPIPTELYDDDDTIEDVSQFQNFVNDATGYARDNFTCSPMPQQDSTVAGNKTPMEDDWERGSAVMSDIYIPVRDAAREVMAKVEEAATAAATVVEQTGTTDSDDSKKSQQSPTSVTSPPTAADRVNVLSPETLATISSMGSFKGTESLNPRMVIDLVMDGGILDKVDGGIMEDEESVSTEIWELQQEVNALKRMATMTTPVTVPNDESSPFLKKVSFAHPIVTAVKHRPKTQEHEVGDQYWDEDELLELEEARENRVWEDEVEVICTDTSEGDYMISVSFPKQKPVSNDGDRPRNSPYVTIEDPVEL